MPLPTWLRPPARRTTARPAPRPAARLGVHRLEDRSVPSTVSGVVFDDADGSGTRGPAEAGLAGWTVFVDTNRNSVLDPGEAAALTAADGGYLFDTTALPPAQVGNSGAMVDYVGLVLETGSGGRWLNTTAAYGFVRRDLEPTAVRDFGVRFQPYAGFAPDGAEARVNVGTAGQQGAPAVAADAAGNYAVAWRTFGSGGTDTIVARIFNADGSPRTGDLAVGSAPTGIAVPTLRVAMSGDGSRVVVAWSGSIGVDSASTTFRVYTGTGTAVTGPTVLGGSSTTAVTLKGVTADADGDFAVLYGQSTYTPPKGITIGYWTHPTYRFQRYTPAGAASGKPIDVATPWFYTGYVNLGMDAAGNAVAVWDDGPRGGGATMVYAQRYDAAGRKLGPLITVASVPSPDGGTAYVSQSALTVARNGRFLVTWVANDNNALTPMAQMFTASGSPAGAALVGVGGTATLDDAGNVTFVWTAAQQPSPSGSYATSEVWARRLTAGGVLEPATLVNTTTQGAQLGAGVAATGDGRFVAVWEGYGPGDDAGVFAQRFAPVDALYLPPDPSDPVAG